MAGIRFAAASKPGDMPEHRPGMMAMAARNDYSDLEDEMDVDSASDSLASSFQSHQPFHNTSQSPATMAPNGFQKATSSTNSQEADLVNQYGIGAQLLLKLGYKQGTGLGSKQDGITAPIETKLRPQGLGVGGVSEKVGSQPVEKAESKSVTFAKPTYDLFFVIKDLEKYGVEVPLHYKELSDNSANHSLEVESAYKKLDAVRKDVAELQSRMQKYTLEIEHSQAIVSSEQEEKNLLERIAALMSPLPQSLAETSEKLKEIALPTYSKVSQIQELFVSLAQPYLNESIASSTNGSYETLAEWALLYRAIDEDELGVNLNLWDSAVISTLESLNSDNPAAFRESIRFWLDSPVIINSLVAEHHCVKTIVVPVAERMIANWQMKAGFEPEILEFLTGFNYAAQDQSRLFSAVASRYATYFSSCFQQMLNLESSWAIYREDFEPALEHFTDSGAQILEQHDEREAESIKHAFTTALLSFCRSGGQWEWSIGQANILKVVCDMYDQCYILSPGQYEILLEFVLLNPMVDHLRSKLERDQDVESWFYRWQEEFELVSTANEEAKELLLWYTNAFIREIESAGGKDVRTVLPRYNGRSFSVSEIEKVLVDGVAESSVHAVAVSDLVATFKDVVLQMCEEHGAELIETGAQDAEMHNLLELEFKGKSYACYIERDILWVSGQPVDLEEFFGVQ